MHTNIKTGILKKSPANFLVLDRLLREPGSILEQITETRELQNLVRTMMFCILISGVIFGGVLGFYRGGIQIIYAACKFPLVILLTACIGTPALSALNSSLGRHSSLLQDISLVLCSLALGGLVLAAQAPLLLFASMFGASYHEMILLACFCCLLGGFLGLRFFLQGLRKESNGVFLAACGLLMVFALGGTQISWTLRPYLVRPKTEEIPFIRGTEGNMLEAILLSIDSARGVYHSLEDFDRGGFDKEAFESSLLPEIEFQGVPLPGGIQ